MPRFPARTVALPALAALFLASSTFPEPAPHHPPQLRLPAPESGLPGWDPSRKQESSLLRAREALLLGHRDHALALALDTAKHSQGSKASDAWFLVGRLALEGQEWSTASDAFYRVRSRDAVLEGEALFFEATADLARGRAAAALKECDLYLDRHGPPKSEGELRSPGPRWRDCQLLAGDALAELRQAGAANKRYSQWLKGREQAPEAETAALRKAQALEKAGMLDAAARRYRRLTETFRYPTTEQVASQALLRLEASGVSAPVSGFSGLLARVRSLSRAGKNAASQDLFDALWLQSGEQAEQRDALSKVRRSTLWSNRQYQRLGRSMKAGFEAAQAENNNGEAAEALYWMMRAATRQPDWSAAAAAMLQAETLFPKHRRFRDLHRDLGWIYMAGRDYARASVRFDAAAQKGSRRDRREASYLARLAQSRSGDCVGAIPGWKSIAENDPSHRTGARFHLARCLETLGEHKQAASLQKELIANAPYSLFSQVLRGSANTGIRAGRWFLSPPPAPPSLPSRALFSPAYRGGNRLPTRPELRYTSGWSVLGEGGQAHSPPEDLGQPSAPAAPAPFQPLQAAGPIPSKQGRAVLKTLMGPGLAIWPALAVAPRFERMGLTQEASARYLQAWEEW